MVLKALRYKISRFSSILSPNTSLVFGILLLLCPLLFLPNELEAIGMESELEASQSFKVASYQPVKYKPVKYQPVPNNVSYSAVTALEFREAAHQIRYGSDPLQYGLLWPARSKTPQKGLKKQPPLVIFVHGGCWLNLFDVKHSYAFATGLSQAGYPVYSIEYRRTGDKGGGWPGSLSDVRAAIEKGVAELRSMNLPLMDTNNVILMGHSAGGHLALLADALLRDGKGNHQSGSKFEIIGTYGLAAITNIERYAKGRNSCQTATQKFMGGSPLKRADAYREANPANKEFDQTIILFQGASDTIVPMEQAKLFDKNGKPLQVTLMDGAGHFDWIHPGSPAFSVILEQLALLTSQ